MAVLGLRFCARAFSSCGKRGPLFISVRGPLTIAASLVAEHRLQTRRLSIYVFLIFKFYFILFFIQQVLISYLFCTC